AKLLGAGGDVQGVQLFHVVGNTTANLFRPRQRVERVGGAVNDRSPGNTDLRHNVRVPEFRGRDRGDTVRGVDEAGLPELVDGKPRRRAVDEVKGVDAVVLGGDKGHVVRIAADHQVGLVERLRVQGAVDRLGNEPAKVGRVDVAEGQRLLLQVLTVQEQVVMKAQDIDVGRGGPGFGGFQGRPVEAAACAAG